MKVADIIINDGNDGIAQSGETIGLSIPLINYGSDVDGVTAILSSTSEFVTIENQVVNYSAIESGTSLYGDDFIIFISPSTVQYENF